MLGAIMRLTPLLVLFAIPVAACAPEAGGSTDAGSSSGEASGSSGGSSGSTGDSTGATGGAAETVVVRGDAFAFTLPGMPYGLIADAKIGVLELPEVSVVTDAMGHFEFPALPAGATATFVLEHADFPPARTRTFTLPDSGALERVTFQVPDMTLYGAIAGIVGAVTRVGKSIYDAGAHGEADAAVTIAPAIPAAQGPIYFGDDVIPDAMLTQTSSDGGVLFVNVPPGTYELQAHKDGVMFESTTMQCAAGVLVNASPPYGLQALP